MTCDRLWELRAIDEGRLSAGDASAFERHTRMCAECRREAAAQQELRDLARQMPGRTPNDLDLRRLRRRLLREAMGRPSRSRTARALWTLAAVMTLAVALVLRHHSTRTTTQAFAGAVIARPIASWTQTREGGLERVVLSDGNVTVHVRKQRREERFIVALPDGEVEVRGTTFEVTVGAGRTTGVHVDEGTVIVRIGAEVTLTAGQSWIPPKLDLSAQATKSDPEVMQSGEASVRPARPEAATAPQLRTARTPAPHHDGGPVHGAPTSVGDELESYDHAVEAYRLGRFEHAADLSRQFALSFPSSSLLDDALFIEASSQASSGHADVAAELSARHVARFPASFHAKDCAILIARHHRDQGDCVGARDALSQWSGAREDATVKAALGGCAP